MSLFIVLYVLYEISRIDKSRETESKLVVASGWGKGEIGGVDLLSEYEVLFWGVGNAL